MPVHFLLVEDFLFDENSMNCRNYSRGHEHDQDVPVSFVKSFNANDSCANTCQKRPKSIILISQPSNSAFYQPQCQSGCTEEEYDGKSLLVKRVVKVLLTLEEGLATFDELEN